jgi:hypothetical protein
MATVAVNAGHTLSKIAAQKADLLHAIYDRIVVAGRIVRLTKGINGQSNRSAQPPLARGRHPAAASVCCSGPPGGIRTPDLLIRSQSL